MPINASKGFTLIELVVAMAVFSFLLLIIIVGFTNIVQLHDEAIAANMAQDNARTAMNTLVTAVRNSQGVAAICDDTYTNCSSPNTPTEALCLNLSSSSQMVYFVGNGAGGTLNGVMYSANNCAPASRSSLQALTDTTVKVTNFVATLKSSGPDIVKPDVGLNLTVASSNGTTTTTGSGISQKTVCTSANFDREFCSQFSLSSGAVPR